MSTADAATPLHPDPDHAAERAALGIPPLPLTAAETQALCERLRGLPAESEEAGAALRMLAERVAPGVDPAAEVKAAFLAEATTGGVPALAPAESVRLLGTMLGGYNLPHLIALLDDPALGAAAAEALRGTILVFDRFDAVAAKAEAGNPNARAVLQSWAEAEWFTRNTPLPETIEVAIYKVAGETNTDDLSPAQEAPTRPDIPLHALAMGQSRFPEGIEAIATLRAEGAAAGRAVAFVGEVVGTGSSRKSATNSLIWHIGRDIPCVPNKRRGGVVIGEAIAPIFFNTFEDAGGLPLRVDSVAKLATGDVVTLHTREGRVVGPDGATLATFELAPATLADEYRAGGRVPLIIGRKLTARAREVLGLPPSEVFVTIPPRPRAANQGYTLAQKMVGRACGMDGVLPGDTVEPLTTTVGSQDTTGPMTRDEMVELACLRFQAPLVMQSFCHTAAYPTDRDRATHATLPGFITDRGGVALRPGDGIVHSWLNRLLVPDTVGTGGDSHTRFPLGISFPAGSGLVAFAAALGCMPLDMPESVLVKLTGDLPAGLTLRDVVNAIPLKAIEAGLQSPFGAGSVNIFNSRILEMEGTRHLTVEQAFELTCAAAERSAAGATVDLDAEGVAQYLKSNVALMKYMIAEGYEAAETLRARVAAVEAWLANPVLMRRDESAEYAATLEIDLSALTEPALACPNNPDNVAWLSQHAGAKVDEVFLGSCMTNIAHFRAAARYFMGALGPGAKLEVKRLWVTPPTKMDFEQLAREGVIGCFESIGARVEIPGCSLCMGNQARVDDGVTVFSTSTRNFDNRMGKGARVFLGSAELAGLVARIGRIPTPEEYFKAYKEAIAPHAASIYRYLYFHEMPEYAR